MLRSTLRWVSKPFECGRGRKKLEWCAERRIEEWDMHGKKKWEHYEAHIARQHVHSSPNSPVPHLLTPRTTLPLLHTSCTQVLAGEKTEKEALEELLDAFEGNGLDPNAPGLKDHKVTYQEFEAYYSAVSRLVPLLCYVKNYYLRYSCHFFLLPRLFLFSFTFFLLSFLHLSYFDYLLFCFHSSIDDDDYFALMMQNAWKISE